MTKSRDIGKGGKRPGAGRPRSDSAPLRIRTVTLSDEDVEVLRALGAGNVSAGVRQLVAEKRGNASTPA